MNADVLGALALTNAGNCRNWICKRVCGVKAVDGGRERGREGERERGREGGGVDSDARCVHLRE